jgi:hypothetical protein
VDNFPTDAQERLDKCKKQPERVNFTKPPSKRIVRKYSKTVDGYDLFSKADSEVAYEAHPHLKQKLDAMLNLVKQAG